MRSEPLLFGATILVTLLVSCHSRVMLDKFWVEARHPIVATKSIRDIPIQEVEPPTASRTTQNYILSPSKMSQDIPRYKFCCPFKSYRYRFQSSDQSQT